MSDQFRLVGLGSTELLAGLSALVQQSNVLHGHLLAHLVELEDRLLHLELGFSSLFAYCVEGLGMSEGSAGRRVTAARVCRRFPELFERVARGNLHLCALCALAPHLNRENAAGLFEACRGKSRRQIEILLAARFPRPDVREQIRRLPTRVEAAAKSPEQASRSALANVNLPRAANLERLAVVPTKLTARPAGASAAGAGAAAAGAGAAAAGAGAAGASAVGASPIGASARRRGRDLEPLSADRFGVHFTADAELRDLIERARGLASHRLPHGDLAGLVKLMAECFVRHEEKRRFGVGARPRRARAKTKVVPAAGRPTPPVESEAVLSAEQPTSTAVPRAEPPTATAVSTTVPRAEPPTSTAVSNGWRSAEMAAPPGEGSQSSQKAPAICNGRATSGRKRGRYLAAGVRREVHGREQGQCAFVAADGRRCTCRVLLEFDHIQPFARLGAGDALNIRLLCRAHNLLHARNCFGALHLAAKIAARKRPNPKGARSSTAP